MRCVSSVSYSVMVNGSHSPTIVPTRGLRQGDSLSPYLFLFCAEAFSALLRQAEHVNLLHGARICRKAPAVSHLLFADDSLVFGRATSNEFQRSLLIIQQYCNASGQMVNFEKSEVVFSKGVSEDLISTLTPHTGIQSVQKIVVYLGMPTHVGRSKKALFAAVEDRVAKKLKSWKNRSLSIAGKMVLAKSVAQAIPTYLMSCLLFPEGTCQKLNSLISSFWWGQKETNRCIHWLSWEKLSQAKKDGGLGFRDFSCFNRALLAKQSWRLLNHENTLLAKSLKARYFPRNSFLEASIGYNPSYVWRSILAGREVITRGTRWNIRNGRSINIWTDPWVPNTPNFRIPGPAPVQPQVHSVSDLIDDNKTWDKYLVSSLFPRELCTKILGIPISASERQDCLMWDFTKDGNYSVKSGYLLAKSMEDVPSSRLQTPTNNPPNWSQIWKLCIPPKIQLFLWRSLNQILPTRMALTRRGIQVDPTCPRCGLEPETDTHVFMSCRWAVHFWASSVFKINFQSTAINLPLSNWISAMIKDKDQEFIQLFVCHLWIIWRARNVLVFQNKVLDSSSCYHIATYTCMEYTSSTKPPQSTPAYVAGDHNWRRPPTGFVKLNLDASIQKDLGAGLGGVFRNEEGEGLSAFAFRRDNCVDVSLAEASACLKGTKIAVEMRVPRIIIESDCVELVNGLKRIQQPPSYLGNIIS